MLLPFQDALARLLDAVPDPEPVEVPLDECAGHILAEDVKADRDLPPFNKSFMDGYALKAEDTRDAPVRLRVVGLQGAGRVQGGLAVEPGAAVQIMTGAPLPPGADCVQMVEKTRRTGDDEVEIREAVEAGTNIAPRGDEIARGETALERGRFIGPAEVAVLATFGYSRVKVFRRLEAAIFTTGDELTAVEEEPEFGQIRNSNIHMLAAQCRRAGLRPCPMPVVPDRREAVGEALKAAHEFDVALFSGGVSAGEYDFVHSEFPETGLEVLFHKVAVKPGKPFLAAREEGLRMVFGLPGNPVSAFVTFEILVRPAVRRWMGFSSLQLPRVEGRLESAVRQKPGRLFFKPAHTRRSGGGYRVDPIETRGSADIVGFSKADSLVLIPAEAEELPEGASVEAVLLPDHAHRGERG